MGGSYRAEVMKLLKRPAMWILGVVFLVLAQVFGYLIPYVAYRSGGGGGFAAGETPAQLLADLLPARLVPNTLGGFPMFAGAIALIIGGLVAGSEYGLGTLKTILTQRPRRLSVLGGKLLAVAVAAVALVLAAFAMNALWSWVIASVEGRPADWPSLLDLSRGLGAGFLIIGMWGLFGALLGTLFRNTSLAVGLGLVWALVVENLIRGFAGLLGFLDAFQKGLPGVNAGSLVASLGATTQDQPGGTPGVTTAVSGPQAVLVLLAYVAVLVLIAGLTLQHQDVK
ncbi:MAG TPA: ABC transporter permease subunit [Actinomycetota bacterium]|nr:ABC transporter permease subunit [Actinomycetota bacterium]